MKPVRTLRRGRASERGQAMLEYSAVTWLLVMAGGVSIIVVIPSMMNALNIYLRGIYYILNLALP